ncbi:MAG: SDR family NAD(P)-dependent oxidoreductase [Pseudomonadota bacterium]
MSATIVITGATSGFGRTALATIAEHHTGPVVVAARDVSSVPVSFGDHVRAVRLDLESLTSVRQFCDEVGDGPICALAMNAGITSNKMRMTEDGFDRTFQVNYLGHFLMFQLLESRLTNDAIVLTTGSGTHDPDEKAPPPAPRHASVPWLAFPDRDPYRDRLGPRAAARAYTASKLCCILLAREIANRYPNLRSVSFDPGFLPETNLSREFPKLVAALVKRIVPHTMPKDRTGTVATTAPVFARLVLGTEPVSRNGAYIAMRDGRGVHVEPSALALRPGVGETLWIDSMELLSNPAGDELGCVAQPGV